MILFYLKSKFKIWNALILREAIDRFFDFRIAWFWLLIEPIIQISLISLVWKALKVHKISTIDISVWVAVGLIGFFLFRRTAVQTMHSIDSNRAYFVYRQIRPFDCLIARASLELFLMINITFGVLIIAWYLGHKIFPYDPLLVLNSLFALWFFGISYGLITSILVVLSPEMGHILKILMSPLYFMSGVIFPLHNLPVYYRDLLMLNPIANGIEMLRIGYFHYYDKIPKTDILYLWKWNLFLFFIGIIFQKFNAQRVIMR